MKQKFTILELLIVISIIVILASLLLPALHQAIQKAEMVQCGSNLKQIGMASFEYCTDNSGVHVTHKLWYTNDTQKIWYTWAADGLDRYLQKMGGMERLQTSLNNPKPGMVWQCPGYRRLKSRIDWDNEIPYGYNWRSAEDCTGDFSKCRQDQIKIPSRMIAFSDSRDYKPNGAFYQSWTLRFSSKGWGYGEVGTRHTKGANICWADGHVAWREYYSVYTGVAENLRYFHYKNLDVK